MKQRKCFCITIEAAVGFADGWFVNKMSHIARRRASPAGRKARKSPLRKRYVLPTLPPMVGEKKKRRKLLSVSQRSNSDYRSISKKGRSPVDVISLDNITSVTNMLRNLENNKSIMRNLMLKFKTLMNDRESALRKCEEVIKAKGGSITRRKQRKKKQLKKK
eukprot:g6993.t1